MPSYLRWSPKSCQSVTNDTDKESAERKFLKLRLAPGMKTGGDKLKEAASGREEVRSKSVLWC